MAKTRPPTTTTAPVNDAGSARKSRAARPVRGDTATAAPTSATAVQPAGKPATRLAAEAAHKPAAERPPRPRAKPAGAYHHGDLREALLDAAEALLAQRGAAGLSLRDVARGAGVSHAAPYHHFAGLPELLAALAERSFQQLGAAMQAGVDAHAGDAREQLLAIAAAYVGFARRRPARFRLMFGPVLASRRLHPGLDHAAEASFRVLLDAATRFDAAAGPLLALTGWSLAHGLSHLSLDAAFAGLPLPGPLPDAADLVRLMSERVLGAQA
ncbi:MAG: TetR/AcrR family transcriptional regulator [Burkholderiales bacterium]|nr:TetR/AcrR family transcriptional regulator [Burkholderiales bacterium]